MKFVCLFLSYFPIDFIVKYSEEILAYQTKDFNMKLAISNDLYKVANSEKKDTAIIYLSAFSMSPFLDSERITHYELFIKALPVWTCIELLFKLAPPLSMAVALQNGS